MSLMQDLQNVLKNGLPQGLPQTGEQDSGAAQGFGRIFGNSGILSPALLGGVVGALFGGSLRSIAGGALLGGGGKALWDKYKQRIAQESGGFMPEDAAGELGQLAGGITGDAIDGGVGTTYAVTDNAARARAERLLRALVYAAKADGHIDETESGAIREQFGKLDLGKDGGLLEQVLAEQPDPAVVAKGVSNAEEALELFTVSASAATPDTFMEKAYMDGLAKALNIPDDVRTELVSKLHPAAA